MDVPKDPDSDCYAPNIPGGWRQGPYMESSSDAAATATPDMDAGTDTGAAGGGNPSAALDDAISVIDASFSIFGDAPCIAANSSVYLSNTYTTGCAAAVSTRGGASVIVRSSTPAATEIMHIAELAASRTDYTDSMRSGNYSYTIPVVTNGTTSYQPLVAMGTPPASSTPPPANLQSKHKWDTAASPDWQHADAANAVTLGCKGDGVTDDYAALQAAVDAHAIVLLPKGIYKVSKTLVLTQNGAALIGVGNSKSFLAPTTAGWESAEEPVLKVAASATGATMKGVTVLTWDHLPLTYAVQWDGADGTWRQSFHNREHEAVFPPFYPFAAAQPAENVATKYGRALMVMSGGGAFYEYNLDFGCCFGTVFPPANVTGVGPGIASTAGVALQQGGYRSLLINGSTSGVRFYPHNMEQDVGDAHTEIYRSTNITMYGSKSEGNHVSVWIKDSDLVTIYGHGGNASPFPNTTVPPADRAQFMPSLFRVQSSSRVTLVNLNNQGRVTGPGHPSTLVAAGQGYDGRTWNMVLRQAGDDGWCNPEQEPERCSATPTLQRPILLRYD